MKLLIHWIISAVIILVLAYVIPGVTVTGFMAALAAALVIGLVNIFIRPLVVLLTLPVTILTLGLFALVINTLMVMLAAWIVPGFDIASFWWALVFSIVLGIVNMLFRTSEHPTATAM